MWDAITAVADFFMGIADAVMGLIDYAIGFISDIVYLVKITGEAVANIPTYFDWLPPSIVGIIVSIFAIVVLYKVLGREG